MAQAQLALLPGFAPVPHFDGETFEPKLDAARLGSQLKAVEQILLDGQWHTIPQVALALRKKALSCTEASISARIRDLRKARFGGYDVQRQRSNRDGLFEYRIATPPEAA